MQKWGKKIFEGHSSTFCIKVTFGIGHPPLTHQMQSTCMWEGSRVQNLQTEFNYLDSFKSYGIFSDFIVPMWSPCGPHGPHIIPVIPTLSPSSLHHPRSLHIVPIAPRRSPCGPHGCGLRGLCDPQPMLSPLSLWSPRHPCHPHVILTLSRRFPHHL